MIATCYFSGRMGNIFYNTAMLLAYCKKYDIKYYIPNEAIAYREFKNGDTSNPFNIESTGHKPLTPFEYREPNIDGQPYFHEIRKFNFDVLFEGYYQSFKYFDWCRDYILEQFNLPQHRMNGMVSISVRRGDCVGVDAFPIAPPEYYYNAISYMQKLGYNNFMVFSDDKEWCMNEFISKDYNDAMFYFSNGSEMEDYISIQNCEHNITARSTFSLSAAWLNQNTNKIVLVPTTKHKYWNSQNKDLIPEYFTQINFENEQ